MAGTGLEKSRASQAEKGLKLFALTWPIFLEAMLFMLMGTVDTFMLSNIADEAVSGVSVSNQMLHVAILIMEVVGNGASIVVAQYLGSRKLEEASKISALAIMLNLVVGIIISISFLFTGERLLVAMNLQGEVLAYAHSYLSIVGGLIFLQALINSISAIIRVHGFTKQAMYVSVGMNVLHIVLNYGLIFGNFGLPAMGVEGAAWSSAISRGLALIVFFWMLYRVMQVRIEWRFYFNMSRAYVGQILKIGLPSALEQVMYQSCQIVFLFMVTFLGNEALAARGYANNISMFVYLFGMAVAMGTSIMVGRHVGAGQMDDAYTRVWKSIKWSFGVTCSAVLLMVLVREPLLRIFTDDALVIKYGAQALLMAIVLESGRSINMVVVNSLRASGDAIYPFVIGIFSMVFMSLTLGYVLVFVLDFGLAGVWLAIAADEWLRAIILGLRWRSRKWEKHAIVHS